MEALTEALMSRNLIVWAIIFVVLVLFLKFLKSAGKGLIILLCVLLLGVVVSRFFPGVVEPMVDFVKGGWLGEHRP